MSRQFEGERIELTATNPDGDLACDYTIATTENRAGLAEALGASLRPPLRDVPGGVEARFDGAAWPHLVRYVDLESRCCSFLSLALSRQEGFAVLTITGRPDARELIRNIFSTPAQRSEPS